MTSVAPAMSAHPVPLGRQRRHWYANDVFEPPFHRPWLALRTLPSSAAPATEGGSWFAGTARCDALLDPTKAAKPIARPEPTERIVRRPIPQGSYGTTVCDLSAPN